ncbi:alpha/beta fold hydrolase [Thalassovita taeanensis]|uniref:Pimeloyl-ACP methyl ester carboxylesterase n=1 Tax=Thalassovita taeanensis TaxID=657014 RepID=A0A1H9I3D7_9RHOB|nr:alpha/beta hydrolase [Thalassovita taeanensis]SEQ69012.1 Pimeloyl-ACP methyl ester carboxylesterase [Thalassovita taeanensis]
MPQDMRGGFPTYWTEFGTGPREALMIHCSLAHSGAWKGLAARLGRRLHMTAFDIPGHGRSGEWDHRGPLQQVTTGMAADFPEGPVDVIGHSFGGTVALRLAVEHPEKVRSLVLIEPVFFAVAFSDRPGLRAQHDLELKDHDDALERGDNIGAARAFSKVWGDGRPWEDLSEDLRRSMAEKISVIRDAAPEINDDSAGILASGALERLKVPTLLIEGGESPDYIGLVNDGLARRLPNARRAVIAGAGHMVPITHPVQVGAEVLTFLDTVPD